MAKSSADGATLFLTFTGHGFGGDSDFFLMATDSSTEDPDSVFPVGGTFQELLTEHSGLDGLVLVLDACESRHALVRLGETLRDIARVTGQRFEVLVSAGFGRAYGCESTLALAGLVRDGTGPRNRFVTAESALPLLRERCPAQHPDHQVFDRGSDVAYSDASLWLSLNAARARTGDDQLADLLTWYRPTAQTDAVLGQLDSSRVVAVTAPAGQGKSTLVAALVHGATGTAGNAPARPDTVAMATATTTPQVLADHLAAGLGRLPEFPDAARTFQQRTSEAEMLGLDALHSQVLGPLVHLARPVVLVVDGLDQLSATAREPVMAALDAVAEDGRLRHVSLIVTARSGTRLPRGAAELPLGAASRDELAAYLAIRSLPSALHASILDHADGNWLVARAYADVAEGLDSAEDLPTSLGNAFDRAIDAAKARPDEEDVLLDAVVTVLAAAGSRPVLPVSVLMDAVHALAGRRPERHVHDVLVRLRGLLVRADAGTPQERIGLFHARLAEHLTNESDQDDDPDEGAGAAGLPPSRRIHVGDGHGALADVLKASVGHGTNDHGSQPFDYTLASEPEHLWNGGRAKAVLHSLLCRTAIRPADNLARWEAWLPRLTDEFGPAGEESLSARYEVCRWIAESGRTAVALGMTQQLVSDCERTLGSRHTLTLSARHDLIRWDGGHDPAALLPRAEALERDTLAVHGPVHADTLGVLQTIAWLEGETDPGRGRRALEQLLPRATSIMGAYDERVFTIRLNITYRLHQEGLKDAARTALAELLADMTSRRPAHSRPVVIARSNLITITAECGMLEEALALSVEHVTALEQIYGDDHPDTLTVRGNHLSFLIQADRGAEADPLLRRLIEDQQRVLGDEHPATAISRRLLDLLGQLTSLRKGGTI